MMSDMDKIVFDIETKNWFDEVGGREHMDRLDVSVVGVYSYADDTYRAYDETEFGELGKALREAYPLIGFSSKQFDVPVLAKYFNFSLAAVPHFDILEEVQKVLGRRVGLGVLAEANLGEGKFGKGADAVDMYRRGDMDALKRYCLQDVKVTKELFDAIRGQGYLWVPRRTMPQMEKAEIHYEELEEKQNALL